MSTKQWVGEAELQGLLKELCGHSSVPTSKVKQIVTACNKYVAEFKMVVYEIERFIKKSNVEDKIGGVFVIDSLCRQHSKEREVFVKRFSIRLRETMSYLQKISTQDKNSLIRFLDEWRKKSVFPPDSLGQIFGDFNITSSSFNAMLSPSKGDGGDEFGKKRSAAGAGLTDFNNVKKASRLCPFREGNCPYGDKCRFNHHDTNSLDQYAARLLKTLTGNRFPVTSSSSTNANTLVYIENVEADSVSANTNNLLLNLTSPTNEPAAQPLDLSVFDGKYWEKSIIHRLHNATENNSTTGGIPEDGSTDDAIVPKAALKFQHRKSNHVQTEQLPMMVMMTNPVLSSVAPAQFFEVSHQNLVELYVSNTPTVSNM